MPAREVTAPDAPPEEPVERARRGWAAWAAGLAALHVALWALARDRTLIPDEIRPLLVGERGWGALFEFARQDVVQTPLSYVFHKLWLDLFGRTDAAAKASVLATSVPSLVLFTWLASRVTRAWRAAAVLFALPFLKVGASVGLVRMYGLGVLLAVVLFVLWWRWRRAPTLGALALWGAVMALLLWTHASGLLLLGAFVVVNALYGPRPVRFACAAGAALLSLVPWLLYVRPVYAERGLDANLVALRASPNRELYELPFFLLSTEDPGGGSPPPPLHLSRWRPWLERSAALACTLLFLSAWRGILAGRPRRADLGGGVAAGAERPAAWIWITGLALLLPILVLYVFSLTVAPGLSARYFLVELPAAALFLALLGAHGGLVGRALLFGVLIPWGALDAGLTLARHLRARTVGDVAELVAAELAPDERVVCTKHMPLGWQFHWEWSHRLGRPEKVEIVALPMEPWIADIVPGVLLEELPLEGVRRIWYVHENLKRRRLAEQALRARGFVVEREILPDPPALLIFGRASK